MKNPLLVKNAIRTFLILHTAIIVMISFLIVINMSKNYNLYLLAVLVVTIIVITVYTSKRINNSMDDAIKACVQKLVDEEREEREKAFSKRSSEMNAESEKLSLLAEELAYQARLLQERECEFTEKVQLISAYGYRMNELVAVIDTFDASPED